MKNFFTKIFNFILNHFTLGKLLGGLFTALLVASLKYYISGNLYIEYSDFWDNLGIGLLSWTINTSATGWLSDYLEIRGINITLNQFIYGFDSLKMDHVSSLGEFKPKLYNAMDLNSDGESNPSNKLDKGKGVDRDLHPYYDGKGIRAGEPSGENKSLDKSKVELDLPKPTNPFMVTWYKVFPGMDPTSIVPKRINPGPGFNVPGGEVPIRDEICKHIDYNSHFLNQFKNMDLETALEQKK
jgi:hypothetical protein